MPESFQDQSMKKILFNFSFKGKEKNSSDPTPPNEGPAWLQLLWIGSDSISQIAPCISAAAMPFLKQAPGKKKKPPPPLQEVLAGEMLAQDGP